METDTLRTASNGEEEAPEVFYFNGAVIPSLALEWPLFLRLLEEAAPAPDLPGEEMRYRLAQHDLACRLHHAGGVESEDPMLFQACVLEMLALVLTHAAQVVAALREGAPGRTDSSMLEEIVEGQLRLVELSREHRMAFWTNGGAGDRARLLARMAAWRLGVGHPGFMEAPHVLARRHGHGSALRARVKALRQLSHTRDLTPRIRSQVNQLRVEPLLVEPPEDPA